MFPPQSGNTTFLPVNSGTNPARHDASGAAPAPSTTAFSSSSKRSIANAISCSPTSKVLSTKPRATPKACSPTLGMLKPSASVGLTATVTGWPAASAAVKLAARAGSTPMIFTPGFTVLNASATPAIRPPPPMGTITASTSGT